MAVSVPLPAPFMPCPGEPAIAFTTWLKMFENYMLVIDATGDSWPDARKRAVLLHALGTEGQRLFYALPNTGDTYASAVEGLKQHFVPKVNVIAERHKFRQRAQRPDETVQDYLAVLRQLAATCEFGNMEDQMVRDQLIERVDNTRIRDRLLLEPDLTLAKAATLALQIETGIRDAAVIADSAATAPAPVRAIHLRSREKKPKTAPATAANTGKYRSCYRCGSTNHMANKPSCPAAKAPCNSCGKVGHFAKVCRSAKKEVRELQINELTVLYMNDTVQDKILCTVHVDANGHSHDVELIVDTGSSVSILPVRTYLDFFPTCELAKPTVSLCTYSKCRKDVIPELVPYFNVRDELAIDDSLIMRGTDRLIVPVSLRSKVINLAHEGHQGLVRTKQRLRELYWWPKMDNCALQELLQGGILTTRWRHRSAKWVSSYSCGQK
ncbi:uncharacterized protein LOC113153427 [Anabas testudineus]|uniref:uncharacterized protein LOC113153427 n=1 Tax=Anabas testudineus TaxID=64144 RepID=UPI000E4589C7|nr:uncharacterized protein LOC113153427 [Anabas testudineus]